jgi:hypothetical protein
MRERERKREREKEKGESLYVLSQFNANFKVLLENKERNEKYPKLAAIDEMRFRDFLTEGILDSSLREINVN